MVFPCRSASPLCTHTSGACVLRALENCQPNALTQDVQWAVLRLFASDLGGSCHLRWHRGMWRPKLPHAPNWSLFGLFKLLGFLTFTIPQIWNPCIWAAWLVCMQPGFQSSMIPTPAPHSLPSPPQTWTYCWQGPWRGGNWHSFSQDQGEPVCCSTRCGPGQQSSLLDIEDGTLSVRLPNVVFNAIVIFEGTLPYGCLFAWWLLVLRILSYWLLEYPQGVT